MSTGHTELWTTLDDRNGRPNLSLLTERPSIAGETPFVLMTKTEYERIVSVTDALLNHCDKEGGECSECSRIVCPHKDPMHFHHDGCPSCDSLSETQEIK